MAPRFQYRTYTRDHLDALRAHLETAGSLTPAVGEMLRAATAGVDLNETDLERYLFQQHTNAGIRVLRASVSVASGSAATVTFDTQDWVSSTETVWDGSTKITVGETGLYTFQANATYPAHATGDRGVLVILNGTTEIGADIAATAAAIHRSSCSDTVQLAAGDQLTLQAFQSSTASLTMTNARLAVVYLGDLG